MLTRRLCGETYPGLRYSKTASLTPQRPVRHDAGPPDTAATSTELLGTRFPSAGESADRRIKR